MAFDLYLLRINELATKMNLDFTLAKYEELCSAIVQSGYAVVSVKYYLSLSLQPREKVVILRHDVDRKPEKALNMAEIERESRDSDKV
jgi:hypothetical protein